MRFGLDIAPQYRVFGGFFVYSFCIGSIFPRLPGIQYAMGVGEGALGLGLIGVPVGTLISLSFGAPLLERFGHRRSLLVLMSVLGVFYAAASFAPNPVLFFLALLPAGLAVGLIEMVLNLEADRVEHQLGFRIMNRSHAFWSIGFFTAGFLASLIAQAGISPQVHLVAMVPVVVIGVIILLGRFEPAPHRDTTSSAPAPRFALPSPGIMVLVTVTLSAMLMEGAGIDWSAIYMRTTFQSPPFLAGMAVAVGALTQAVTRFFADSFVERYSPALVTRVLLVLLGMGALLVWFSPYDWSSLIGFALMGVGTSVIFPLAMSAAAQRTDRPAAVNVAALAQTSFVVFLLGPPLLGFVAEHWGIRLIYGLGIPLVVVSFILAGALGRKPVPHEVD